MGAISIDAKVAIAISAIFAIALFNNISLLPWTSPLTEDAYYLYDISRSLSRGHGFSTANELTNGFQPLLVILIAPIFMFFDGELAVIFVQFINYLLFCLSSLFMYKAAFSDRRSPRMALVFFLAYFSSFELVRHAANGMETALLIFLYSALLLVLSRGGASSLQVGCLLGLLGLARVDFCIFILLFLLLNARRDFVWSLRCGLIALALVGPWLLYNKYEFGSFMPGSGKALAFKMDTPLWVNSAGAIRRCLSLFDFVERSSWLLLIVFPLCAYGIVGIWKRSNQLTRAALLASSAFLVFVFIWYPINSYAAFFYPRYFILLTLLATLGFASFFASSSMVWRNDLLVFLAASIFLWNAHVFYSKRFYGISYWNGPTTEQVDLAKKYNCAMYAGFQSGTLSFYNEGKVINLDGKVSNKSMKALYDGSLDRRIDDFDCLIDFYDYIAGSFYWDPRHVRERMRMIWPVGHEPDKYEYTVWVKK